MSKRKVDRWDDADRAWKSLNDPTARIVLWMDDGTPRIVAQREGRKVTLLASPAWETVAELLTRAAADLQQEP